MAHKKEKEKWRIVNVYPRGDRGTDYMLNVAQKDEGTSIRVLHRTEHNTFACMTCNRADCAHARFVRGFVRGIDKAGRP